MIIDQISIYMSGMKFETGPGMKIGDFSKFMPGMKTGHILGMKIKAPGHEVQF